MKTHHLQLFSRESDGEVTLYAPPSADRNGFPTVLVVGLGRLPNCESRRNLACADFHRLVRSTDFPSPSTVESVVLLQDRTSQQPSRYHFHRLE